MTRNAGAFRAIATIVAHAVLLQACGSIGTHPDDSPTLSPAARYAQLEGSGKRYSEHLVRGQTSQRDSLGDFPMASGPMPIDCRTIEEIGMIVRHSNWAPSGYYHMYTFTLQNADASAPQPDYFSYRKLMTRGYVRGAIRFREKPPDGRYILSALHRGDVLLTTEFEFSNCR